MSVCLSFMHSGDLILPVGFLFVCRFECYPLPLPPSPLSLLPSPGNTLLHLFGSWLFEASVWPFHGRVVVSAAVKQSLCTTRTLHCCLQSALGWPSISYAAGVIVCDDLYYFHLPQL